MASPKTPAEFISKWQPVTLAERAASHEHFIDLCNLLGQPTPAEHDATGAEYTFEKSVGVSGPASKGSKGDSGFVDAWWRGKFALEYKRKGKYKTLDDAYRQLQQYREGLDNPPLLIVCDIARIIIHTNFTGTAKEVHEIALEDLGEPGVIPMLRRIFTDPESFRPETTPEQVTERIATSLGGLAQRLRDRGHDPHDAAHFLMKCMFCLFAEDVNLLPKERFLNLLSAGQKSPEKLRPWMDELFDAMREGGHFWGEAIEWFNGGLFDDSPALDLEPEDVSDLIDAADQDWGAVEPAIFGTLFERSLDPSKRAQIGAHYTSRDDIMLVIEPVILRPLRAEWDETREQIEAQLERRRNAKTAATKRKADQAIADLFDGFFARLSSVRVLDPACGSGNFLYVAIQQLLNLEKEVLTFAASPEFGVGGLIPRIRPTQLHGIEINPYAAELAQVVIWIGYLQWMRDNGFNPPADPILAPLTMIEKRDAILKWLDENGEPISAWHEGAACAGQAEWPDADYIVGNPPFLGSKVFRKNGLADSYVNAIYSQFDLPNTSDLCCYWFLLAERCLAASSGLRVGLLATQGIRGTDNRTVLTRIKEGGVIYEAWSDRNWILDGAAVHVSIIAFARDGLDTPRLDGEPVDSISADLRGDIDLTLREQLAENDAIGWSIGTQKGGAFEFDWTVARDLLLTPNPNGRGSLNVLRPWRNASDLTRRLRGLWIVDFGPDCEERDAAGYQRAFEHVRVNVKPVRDSNRRDSYRLRWWIHQEPRSDLRPVLETPTILLTPRVAKHRLWTRSPSDILPDCALCVFARSDDYFFGVLHSCIHELWALRQGTQLESRPRYTPTTCFETFPFPWTPGEEPTDDPLHSAIGEAACDLDTSRERWLNPPEWIEPIAARIDAEDDFEDVARVSGEDARRLIRESAIQAAAAKDKNLKKRTLTNLYNERPTWLRLAHERLDRAVLAAYAAIDPEGEWSQDWAEVWIETGAGQPLPEGHDLSERRAEVDERVLGNLLRLNLDRTNG